MKWCSQRVLRPVLLWFVPLFLASPPESDRKDLLSELDVLKTLKPHPHVTRLLGCVTETGKETDIQLRWFNICA